MNCNIVILLTACVNPNGMLYTALQDVETRKKQYLEAIDYYLQKSKYNVVFVENTGTDLSHNITIPQNKKFEYLTFQGNDYDKRLGKGYGEAKIIEYAISHSQLILNARYIIKITGRVKVLNINTLLYRLPYRFVKKSLIQVALLQDRISSICFVSTKEWLLKVVRKYGKLINDTEGFYFEHMLYRPLVECKQIYILPCFPIIEGISGTTKKAYINRKMLDRKINWYSSLCNLYIRKHEYAKQLIAKMLLYYYMILNKMQTKYKGQF